MSADDNLRLTLWLYKKHYYKEGKVTFVENGRVVVKNPKRIETGLKWCRHHAAFVGGRVIIRGNKVAVFLKAD